ncbi:hypothetical protein EJB05_24523 [Eragrostis curvula]|uniref:Knottin scorpion toxin-like domain-containing protein n=1 Tax=Eragrostis curvula TaxID=38414 RepID=A0A5J9V9W7_9POAL|nr:hypothetical protein EJB05_24501 [Eragrostis curvula]TVU32767.1 hypothetical protein EJB05_24523 [Eragrostis curvula]
MACKATAVGASALIILSLVFMSFDSGVDAWCLSFPSPDSAACREKGGLKNCAKKCEAVHYDGGQCDTFNDCLCVKCVDQGPPPAQHTLP